MKKLLYLFVAAATLSFTSCLDTVETMSLKEDGSGNYKLTIDMAKMMGMMSAFGGENKKTEKKDTVIYFKEYADTSTALTAEEKEILKTGKLSVNMDTDKGDFKNPGQLVYLRNHLAEMIEKTKAMDKLDDKKKENTAEGDMDMTPKMKPGTGNANPFKDYYEFSVTANSLSYQVKDTAAALKAMEESEDLKSLKQMAPMMGEMTYTTTIELPRPATKVEGVNAKLSDNKKTVTITASFQEMFTNVESMAFKVEY
jgi:hypothetical protein